MIGRFADYWTEYTPSRTKMRYETEKTWETAKRLAVWASREPAARTRAPAVSRQAAQQQRMEQTTDLFAYYLHMADEDLKNRQNNQQPTPPTLL